MCHTPNYIRLSIILKVQVYSVNLLILQVLQLTILNYYCAAPAPNPSISFHALIPSLHNHQDKAYTKTFLLLKKLTYILKTNSTNKTK